MINKDMLLGNVVHQDHEDDLFFVDISESGEPNFRIGNQTFTLQFDTNQQDRSEAAFYARMLNKALSNLVEMARLPATT